MAKKHTPVDREKGKDNPPPRWLQPYMGKKWKPLTLAAWYSILVKAEFIIE